MSLRSEGDLVKAVTLTLEHAIATSERYRGTSPRVQKFVRSEISKRRQHLNALSPPVKQGKRTKRGKRDKPEKLNPVPALHLAIVPADERSYLQAMQRNHARLIELIEYGMGLPLSAATKKTMETLMRGAITELAVLEQLESS